MPATNILANLFVTLYNNETRRNIECTILPTSKIGIEVLKTLQKEGYVGEFEHIDDKRGGKFKIKLFIIAVEPVFRYIVEVIPGILIKLPEAG